MSYRDFVHDLLRQSSRIATDNFGRVVGSVKAGDNNQVLTETDLQIGTLLVGAIAERFPTHNIIDEESGVIDRGSTMTWVIDPIDGTSNFAAGLPLYGIMLGLLENDQPIAGGIALPGFDEMYYAERGAGAYCNDVAIHVSTETQLLNSLVAYGIDGHQEDPRRTVAECATLAKIVLGIRNLRSSNSAYDIAQVATGKYGACLNQTSKIWDNVAQQVIITEAGGIYTDWRGEPMDYTSPLAKAESNFQFIAGAPDLHRELMSILVE